MSAQHPSISAAIAVLHIREPQAGAFTAVLPGK
jgi:hypothetical protein